MVALTTPAIGCMLGAHLEYCTSATSNRLPLSNTGAVTQPRPHDVLSSRNQYRASAHAIARVAVNVQV